MRFSCFKGCMYAWFVTYICLFIRPDCNVRNEELGGWKYLMKTNICFVCKFNVTMKLVWKISFHFFNVLVDQILLDTITNIIAFFSILRVLFIYSIRKLAHPSSNIKSKFILSVPWILKMTTVNRVRWYACVKWSMKGMKQCIIEVI